MPEMKQGNFYFITDDFFEKYDPEHNLMRNKENGNNRPCFYALAFSLGYSPRCGEMSQSDKGVGQDVTALGMDIHKSCTLKFRRQRRRYNSSLFTLH